MPEEDKQPKLPCKDLHASKAPKEKKKKEPQKCSECDKTVTPLTRKENNAKTKVFCPLCFDKLYFRCNKDERYKLKSLKGIRTCTGIWIDKKFSTTFSCPGCDKDTVMAAESLNLQQTVVVGLGNGVVGPMDETRAVCPRCRGSGKVVMCEHTGLYVLRAMTIQLENRKFVMELFAHNYKRSCEGCGTTRYSVSPMRHFAMKGIKKVKVCPKCANTLGLCYACKQPVIPSASAMEKFKRDIKDDSFLVGAMAGMGVAQSRLFCDKCGMKYLMEQGVRSISTSESVRQFPISETGHLRLVGVEIECDPTQEQVLNVLKADYEGVRPMASMERDTSLRGPMPIEFISPALDEQLILGWTEKLCGLIKGAGLYRKCSVHIHIDTSDLSWWDINSLMRYTKRYEGDVMMLLPPGRGAEEERNVNGFPMLLPSQYALKFRSKAEMFRCLYGKAEDQNIKQRRANDQRTVRFDGFVHRYLWANFHGHWYKRAIELRPHQGSTNHIKINNWIKLWLDVVNKVPKMKESQWVSPLELARPTVRKFYLARMEAYRELHVDYRKRQLAGDVMNMNPHEGGTPERFMRDFEARWANLLSDDQRVPRRRMRRRASHVRVTSVEPPDMYDEDGLPEEMDEHDDEERDELHPLPFPEVPSSGTAVYTPLIRNPFRERSTSGWQTGPEE